MSIDITPEAVERLTQLDNTDANLWRFWADKASALSAALTASQAETAAAYEAVKVKPLVWFEAELPSRGGGKLTSDGYTIRRIEGYWLLDFSGNSKAIWRFHNIDEAKDAAQSDYAYRIMSALIPSDINAALDRMIADAEERGMRKALDAASDYTQRVYGDDWKFLSNPIDRDRILAAIPKGQDHE